MPEHFVWKIRGADGLYLCRGRKSIFTDIPGVSATYESEAAAKIARSTNITYYNAYMPKKDPGLKRLERSTVVKFLLVEVP